MSTLFDFTALDRLGHEMALKDYEGKVVLVVNTATECGFTPQYADLQKLYAELHDKGLEILDFPCNQFGEQAPGTADEIHTFCTGRFGVEFDQLAKIDVNGPEEQPLYTWLKSQAGFAGFEPQHQITPILVDMFDKAGDAWRSSTDIKWNFTKFLIGKDGKVVKRFEPTADVEGQVKPAIEALL